MGWKMFLDDEKFPIDTNAVIARTMQEAQSIIDKKGCPDEIMFDHDLGQDISTGFDFAKWLVEKDLDNSENFLPINFVFSVHSQTQGKENIEGLLNPYLEYKRTTFLNKKMKL